MDIELVKRITRGTAAIKNENGAVSFHRFTEEQRKVYESNESFLLRSFAAASVRLEFATDAKSFAFGGAVEAASSRDFYFFDVYVNGALVRHVGSYSLKAAPTFRFEIELPEGTNRVAVYFPWTMKTLLSELEFTGATTIEPIEKKRRILCYGDSTTQGYDARYPSLSYANIIADALDAEVMNKAIGGDRFNPELAALPDAGRFDLITVGYGTNDWSHETRETLKDKAERFFALVTRNYPETPVCAILPLWRHDWMRVTDVGTFAEGHAIIRAAAERHQNIKIVDGLKLLPHLGSCLTDVVHPNDFGFQFMARNLLKQLPIV